jgi:hypothetical protein
MCLSNEVVDELHAITSAIKAEQIFRDEWMAEHDRFAAGNPVEPRSCLVTRAEAERIFADRIAAHEARLKELGWSRTVRVESPPMVATGGYARGGGTATDIPQI